MDDFNGRVAVITGAASGIGFAMAQRFASAGMRLALADIEASSLADAKHKLEADGARVLTCVTDVGDAAAMDAFADAVRTEYGGADLVCLNAGVAGGGGPLETLTTEDWAWGLNVNLWGVIQGLRVFLGDLKARGAGHVVITSSVAGLIASPQAGPYHATKHAVAAIAETLFRELHADESKVGVSCLCPGLVATRFPSGDRNRPAELQNPGAAEIPEEVRKQLHEAVDAIFQRGATPEHVAQCVLDAVQTKQFWVYTDEVHREAIRARHRAIESGEDPPTEFGALDGY